MTATTLLRAEFEFAGGKKVVFSGRMIFFYRHVNGIWDEVGCKPNQWTSRTPEDTSSVLRRNYKPRVADAVYAMDGIDFGGSK